METVNGHPVPGRRILIIEDDTDVVTAMKLRLEEAGFSVQSAQDGSTGLAKAHGFLPDIVLLDLAIPAPNGFEVGRQLRENVTTFNIRIIAMTATRGPDIKTALSNVGINEVVFKPFSFGEMVEWLNNPSKDRREPLRQAS